MSPTDRIRRVLADTPGLLLAVLFGSAARQGADRANDLDLGVSFAHGVDPALPCAPHLPGL